VLDTGATLTCLDRSVAEGLALEPYRGARGVGVGVQGSGRMDLVRIDSITFAGTTAYDVMGCVLDLEHLDIVGTGVDGLLGLNVLKEFRVVLDFPGEVVRLERGAAER
ncbi:MAG TPA: aspartyl protease family protein, partial [Longimicrobiales bacterium]|nr:aspartyl protease family protein [Longimicrobiales bacterium]